MDIPNKAAACRYGTSMVGADGRNAWLRMHRHRQRLRHYQHAHVNPAKRSSKGTASSIVA